MELKDRIIKNLKWSNRRLKLINKGLDETQIEIIEFCLLHDLQQVNLTEITELYECLACEKCDKDGWIRENKGDIIESRLCNHK